MMIGEDRPELHFTRTELAYTNNLVGNVQVIINASFLRVATKTVIHESYCKPSDHLTSFNVVVASWNQTLINDLLASRGCDVVYVVCGR